jgi:polyketide-type polyunsaturated fatty acid synthase PfaA
MAERTQSIPVAVVGVGALYPGSPDAEAFWRNIVEGRDLITDVPATHWLSEDYYDPDPSAPDKVHCQRGGFLPTVDFDPMEFGISPRNLPATDTEQLLALLVAKKVLKDASQGAFQKIDRDRMSVILGVGGATQLVGHMSSRLHRPDWLRALRDSGIDEPRAQEICDRISSAFIPFQESTFPGVLGNVVAGRIANRFDLHGTNCVVDAACASSLAALSMGLNELYLGQSDLVIVGGVDALNDILMYMCFAKTQALSRTQDCRPFSQAADGTLLGEGVGMFALRRLEDAERDGSPVYAVIRGLGASSDGSATSVYAPKSEGQALALKRAYDCCGVSPGTVELIEAHGTGTRVGDVEEFRGLKSVYEAADRKDRPWCAVGSVKSQIGHTKAAAGAAGLFKAVCALHAKTLPPTIKIERPGRELGLPGSPFYLNTVPRPWFTNSGHPRRAAVSSFGFGGSNFHVVLEEYLGPNRAPRLRALSSELILLSADSRERLAASLEELARADSPLTALARRTQKDFRADEEFRLALVAQSKPDLQEKATRAAKLLAGGSPEAFARSPGVYFGSGTASQPVAFLFPGQGSQYVGMGGSLVMAFEAPRAVWEWAATLPLGGMPALRDAVFPQPVFSDEEKAAQAGLLNATESAQPAIGITSMAYLELLRTLDVAPTAAAGHSFGELTALYAAGVFDTEGFLRAAQTRGELMARASEEKGAMLATSCPLEKIRELIADSGGGLRIANYNGPRQTVLSGRESDILAIEERLASLGAGSIRLPVSTAFHSPLVEGARAPFLAQLGALPLQTPKIPVFSNMDGSEYPAAADAIRDRLARQIVEPVLFQRQIEAMHEHGVRIFLEVGPGDILSSRVDEILEGKPHAAIAMDRRSGRGVDALFGALAQLATAGVPMRLDALWAGYANAAPPEAMPRRPSITVQINGANYGKPRREAKADPMKQKTMEVHKMSAAESVDDGSRPLPSSGEKRPTPADARWLDAFQELQRQTTQTHVAFQKTMAESHMAYLKTMSSFLNRLDGSGGAPEAPIGEAAAAAVVTAADAAAEVPAAEENVYVAPEAARAEAVAESAPASVPAASSPGPAGEDLKSLLLTIIAEKTGYPAEVLDLSSELDSDLGIDSIKRVEILSAIQERLPQLSKMAVQDVAGLRTLGEVLEFIKRMRAEGALAEKKTAQVPSRSLMSGAPS